MSIFNSLGSNYDFKFAVKALFANGKTDLKNFLEKRYGGRAILLFKGREAITLSLRILNLPKGSQVAINGFTCYAVYRAIEKADLEPILIDLPKDGLNFTRFDLAKAAQGKKIRAAIIQNTLGFPCDIDEISKFCKKNKIFLIEDLAHSAGIKYKNGRETGTIGDITILSFSQDKIIDAVSGGAMIIRNKKCVKENVYSFKNTLIKKILIDRFYPVFTLIIRNTYSIGIGKTLHFLLKKINLLSLPMDDNFYDIFSLPNWYQSLAQKSFKNLEKEIRHRKKIATIYKKNLHKSLLLSSAINNVDDSSNLRFPIFTEKRENLIQYLKRYNIHISDIWYDAVISPKRYMEKIKYKNECPNAEKISSLILNLPTHKNVSEKLAKSISERINEWIKLIQ